MARAPAWAGFAKLVFVFSFTSSLTGSFLSSKEDDFHRALIITTISAFGQAS
jgi:hypothetical protein